VPGFISDGPLARGLIAIGDEAIARQDGTRLRDYYTEGLPLPRVRRRPGAQVSGEVMVGSQRA
jgi:hypothetical protein